MKGILLIIFVILFTETKSQIVFEFDHDSASTFAGGTPALDDQLMIVNFEISGYQYVKINRHGKKICVYDMSHALLKTIDFSVFPQANTANGAYLLYFSEQLFNLDSKKEFMYTTWQGTVSPYIYTGIYNEDGILLFSDTGSVPIFGSVPLQQYPIYNTTSGTKMILSYKNGHAKVFSLTGTLTTAIGTFNAQLVNSMISNPHPNPTNDATTIEYKIPEGVNQEEIVFYNLQGTEIKRFKVDKTFNSLLISTTDIPAGTYYYQLQTSGNTSAGKKMVVVK
ncbi:MAG TPA: T9SS type A sorting domain-containing protein [Bacteroidia bacterium]|jgi:hypothetical protein|nr:T9SS type A sorting domain-containing protein [Bacteroidia bacterium]